jgi:transcriptional regulator with XRE-family HTH domain
MKQTTKSSAKNQTFLERFRDLFNEKGCSQVELANAIGSARGTVATWLDGKTAPNVYMVKALAEYFSVSADYLLCISDTRSSDVNVKAAMEYTGLSEEAIEWLHIGLDDFECDGEVGLDEQTKKENWDAASALIQSEAFSKMIHHLKEVALEAYVEKILKILYDDYSDSDLPEEDPNFRYANKEDRDIVVANHIHVLTTKRPWEKDKIQELVTSMDDNALSCDVCTSMFTAKQSNELHQFHAAKALTGYMDKLVADSHKKAENRFRRA